MYCIQPRLTDGNIFYPSPAALLPQSLQIPTQLQTNYFYAHNKKCASAGAASYPKKFPSVATAIVTTKRPARSYLTNAAQETKSYYINDSCFSVVQTNVNLLVKFWEMSAFLKLLSHQVVQNFLKRDKCYKACDKYLIAATFVYFKRARLTFHEYNVSNFFAALYLAHDIEEDDEDPKYEIFPYCLGNNWRDRYPSFLLKRDALWRRMNYRALVHRQTCEEIFLIQPDHWVWKRQRDESHGGALRSYMRHPQDDGIPRGPNETPMPCSTCHYLSESQTTQLYYSAQSSLTSAASSSSWFSCSTDNDRKSSSQPERLQPPASLVTATKKSVISSKPTPLSNQAQQLTLQGGNGANGCLNSRAKYFAPILKDATLPPIASSESSSDEEDQTEVQSESGGGDWIEGKMIQQQSDEVELPEWPFHFSDDLVTDDDETDGGESIGNDGRCGGSVRAITDVLEE